MGKERLVSIVTPSHDTSDDLFRAAFDSVTAQTLDESEIEWVIVVHNSSPEHLSFVKGLCEGHPGFRVFELNNDKHTASSPRNYALTKVSGRYVTFLDADDRLTPECLATIVSGMDETGAQVGKYRSEKLEEDSSVMEFMDNRVRFDQTKPLICLHNDDPDVRKLMTMANMMMNSQVIEREFIERCDLRFSEEVRIYEDVMFNMECLSRADTIAVFPQLIGYIYYMHSGSTMQELKASTPEKILDTCRDIEKQLKLGVEAGLYMRYLFFGHMKQIADMISASEKEYGFPDEIRREIRDMMSPYFDLIEPPDPDRKFLSREEIDGIMSYVRETIDGPAEAPSTKAKGDTSEVLVDILRSAEGSEIGENWGFDRIRSHDAYENEVPVNTYDTFSPMIDLMRRIGESDILFCVPVAGYAITTGTMNTPRWIPYTERTLGTFTDMYRDILADRGGEGGSCFLIAGSVRGDRQFADGTYPDSITGAVLQNMRKELSYNSHRSGETKGIRLTGPEDLYFLKAPADHRYLGLLFALLDRDVTMIASPFTWTLLCSFRYLEHNHEKLTRDIEQGTLEGAWLSSEEKRRYRALFDADPERAEELRGIFEKGFDEPVIPKIWPKCRRVTAGGSADFLIYKRHLLRYTGTVPVSDGAHAASEAIIGRECGDGLFRLEYGESYFEFIPEDREEGSQNALVAEELEEGRYYDVILTNRSGLYRYDLRDVIRVERMEDGTPVYSLAGRTFGMLTIPSCDVPPVRIRPADMAELMIRLGEHFRVTIADYCVKWDEDDRRIVIYAEPADESGLDRLTEMPKSAFENAAEEMLRDIVPGYARYAGECAVQPLEARLLHPQTQLAYCDKRMYLKQVMPDQIKPVRILDTDPAAQKFFDNFVIEDWK